MANPTEVWPASMTILALNGTTDANTGIPYILRGTKSSSSPSLQEQFDRMMNRLLQIVAPLAQLRPVKVDDTHIGIFAGKYRLGTTDYAYAGEASVAITATDDTYYVYLTSGAGATVVTDATGWPADKATFIPIAEVTVASNVISSILDVRGRVLYNT